MNLYVFIEINNSIKADEKVVMTYVSSYYHAFSTTQKVMHETKRLDKIIYKYSNRPNKQLVVYVK
jgi:hypothetical protein